MAIFNSYVKLPEAKNHFKQEGSRGNSLGIKAFSHILCPIQDGFQEGTEQV